MKFFEVVERPHESVARVGYQPNQVDHVVLVGSSEEGTKYEVYEDIAEFKLRQISEKRYTEIRRDL